MPVTEKYIAHIAISPRAKQILDEVSEHRGMTQKEMMARMLEFFSRQSEAVQAVILGQLRAPALRDAVEEVVRAELKLMDEQDTEGIKRKQGDRRASG